MYLISFILACWHVFKKLTVESWAFQTLGDLYFPATRSRTPSCVQSHRCVVGVQRDTRSATMIPPLCRHFLKPFRPPAVRFSPVLCVSQYIKIIQKKQKGCGVETEQSSPRPAPLSPEQLDKIARNKKAALERLSSVQTPPGFGESWRKALSAEFGKPYFKQVRRGGDGILHTVSLLFWTVIVTSHLSHSWRVLFVKRGNATQFTHLLNMYLPGHRCVTSEM